MKRTVPVLFQSFQSDSGLVDLSRVMNPDWNLSSFQNPSRNRSVFANQYLPAPFLWLLLQSPIINQIVQFHRKNISSWYLQNNRRFHTKKCQHHLGFHSASCLRILKSWIFLDCLILDLRKNLWICSFSIPLPVLIPIFCPIRERGRPSSSPLKPGWASARNQRSPRFRILPSDHLSIPLKKCIIWVMQFNPTCVPKINMCHGKNVNKHLCISFLAFEQTSFDLRRRSS